MTLSRRGMFRKATVGGAAIVGSVVLNTPHAAIAQERTDTKVVLVCTENGVRVRSEPSLSGSNRGSLKKRELVTLTGVPVESEGYRWIPISSQDRNLAGWSVADYFLRQDGSDLGWLPGTRVHVNTTRVNLHDGPGLDFAIVGNFNTPTEAVVNEGPAIADGYTWYNITIDYVTGWMVQDYLTEGPAPAATTTMVAATTSETTSPRRGIFIAAVDTPAPMKAGADYVCDGKNDEVEWQAAIDEAQALRSGGTTSVPSIYILPGQYRIANTVVQRDAPIIGLAPPNSGIRVYWEGADGQSTAIAASVDQVSFGGISNIGFRPGSQGAAPNCWIDLSADAVDVLYVLSYLHFVGSNVCLRVGSWANAHFDHLRFDAWRQYALELSPHQGQNLSSFRLSGFTGDNQNNSPAGFCHINNTAGQTGSVAVGTMSFEDGRLEQHSAYTKGLFVFSGAKARATQTKITNVTSDSGPYTTTFLFREDASEPVLGSETVILDNVRGVRTLMGGNWHALTALPAVGVEGTVAQFQMQGERILHNQRERQYLRSQDDNARETFVGREANPRFRLQTSGRMEWGSGGAAPDTILYRNAANSLRTNGQLTVMGSLDHDGANVGFYGATPVPRPTVTGSRSDGTALQSLLSALVKLGLITDGTTP